jgi:hypothetical protein
MSDHAPLFTREQWEALTDDERELWRAARRREVDAARKEHDARKRLNDSLTVERFSHDHG